MPIGMQRESYDQICDANILLLEDLKERGMSFLREQLCDGVDLRLV